MIEDIRSLQTSFSFSELWQWAGSEVCVQGPGWAPVASAELFMWLHHWSSSDCKITASSGVLELAAVILSILQLRCIQSCHIL